MTFEISNIDSDLVDMDWQSAQMVEVNVTLPYRVEVEGNGQRVIARFANKEDVQAFLFGGVTPLVKQIEVRRNGRYVARWSRKGDNPLTDIVIR